MRKPLAYAVLGSLSVLCSAVVHGTEPPRGRLVTDYQVAISNSMPHLMNFSYRAEGTDSTLHLLGSVEGSSRKVFSITLLSAAMVTIIESGDAMPGHVDQRLVTLSPDSVVEVRF